MASSTVKSVQHRYSHWRLVAGQESKIVDLAGRCPDEIQVEAKRIRLGEEFDTFEEFDRCLHSWSVREGRAYHKFKTKFDCLVRVC
jgi:hypothetical protein